MTAARRPSSTTSSPTSVTLRLDGSNQQLANLCGPLDGNLKQVADGLGLEISRRGHHITIKGEHAQAAANMLQSFHDQSSATPISVDDIQLALVEVGASRPRAKDVTEHADFSLPGPSDEHAVIDLKTRTLSTIQRNRTTREFNLADLRCLQLCWSECARHHAYELNLCFPDAVRINLITVAYARPARKLASKLSGLLHKEIFDCTELNQSMKS